MDGEDAIRAAARIGNVDLVWRRLHAQVDIDTELLQEVCTTARVLQEGVHLNSMLLRESLWLAYQQPSGLFDAVDLSRPGCDTPRYSSGIWEVDSVAGGLYGITAIGGTAGVGKSMLAMQIGVHAARKDVRVVYFNAEMADNQLRSRYHHMANPKDGFERTQFHVQSLSPGDDLAAVYHYADEALQMSDGRLMLIYDSVNTMADWISCGEDYWGAINELVGFLITARRLTEGKVMGVVVSELNQRKELKGAKIEYAADVVMRLTADDDSEDTCEIDIRKGREGGRARYGRFVVDWKQGRFVKV